VDINTSCPLSPDTIKPVQDIVSNLLNNGRAVDPMLLTALSSIIACQANGTTTVANPCQQLLDYVATHPNAGIRYKACDIILAVHTDSSYLSEQNGKSCASAYFYLINHNTKNSTTAPSSHYFQLSNTSCPQLLKRNWLHFTTVANLPFPFAQRLKKWDIHSSNAP
jgi:hypothetical protein